MTVITHQIGQFSTLTSCPRHEAEMLAGVVEYLGVSHGLHWGDCQHPDCMAAIEYADEYWEVRP